MGTDGGHLMYGTKRTPTSSRSRSNAETLACSPLSCPACSSHLAVQN